MQITEARLWPVFLEESGGLCNGQAYRCEARLHWGAAARALFLPLLCLPCWGALPRQVPSLWPTRPRSSVILSPRLTVPEKRGAASFPGVLALPAPPSRSACVLGPGLGRALGLTHVPSASPDAGQTCHHSARECADPDPGRGGRGRPGQAQEVHCLLPSVSPRRGPCGSGVPGSPGLGGNPEPWACFLHGMPGEPPPEGSGSAPL